MYGVVMAGGKSTRMGREKPMLQFQGKKFIDIACEAVMKSNIDCIVAVSKNAPETMKYARKKYSTIETPGIDYCFDVSYIINRMGVPFLSVVSDLPFVTHKDIEEILNDYKGGSVAGALIVNGKLTYVGINIVSSDTYDRIHIFRNSLLSINVNTPEEYERVLLLENLASFHIPEV